MVCMPAATDTTSTPLVLGIETSCDETGVGIVRGTELLANAVASAMEEHVRFGGVIPEIAGRAHLEAFIPTCSRPWTRRRHAAGHRRDRSDLRARARRGALVGVRREGWRGQGSRSTASTIGKPLSTASTTWPRTLAVD